MGLAQVRTRSPVRWDCESGWGFPDHVAKRNQRAVIRKSTLSENRFGQGRWTMVSYGRGDVTSLITDVHLEVGN